MAKASLKQLRKYFNNPKMDELRQLTSEDRTELMNLLGEAIENDPALAAELSEV
jgi:hypothetical protein